MQQPDIDQYIEKGKQLLNEGNFKQAIIHLSEALKQQPGCEPLLFLRAGAYSCSNDLTLAIADLDQCIHINPNSCKSYAQKGYVLHNQKKYKESVQVCQQALKIDKNNIDAKNILKKAQQKLDEEIEKQNKEMQEIEFLQDAVSRLAKHPQYKVFLQDSQFLSRLELMVTSPQLTQTLAKQDKRLEKALEFLYYQIDESQIGSNPTAEQPSNTNQKEKQEEYKIFQCWGSNSSNNNNNEQQVQSKPQMCSIGQSTYQDQVKVDTLNQDKQQQEPQLKQETLKQVEQQCDDPFEQHKQLGNKLFKNKDFKKAISIYESALQINSTCILIYSNLAQCFFELNDYLNAIYTCDTGLSISKQTNDQTMIVQILLIKGKSLVKQKNFNEAIECLKRALQSTQSDQEKEAVQRELLIASLSIQDQQLNEKKSQSLEFLKKGEQFYKENNYIEAIQLIEEGIELYCYEPSLYICKADCLVKQMKVLEAMQVLNRCIQICGKKTIKVWIKKGYCHCFLKEYVEAIDSFNQGLQLDDKNQDCIKGIEKAKNGQFLLKQSSISQQQLQESLKYALQDPEIVEILQDEEIQNILYRLQQHPEEVEQFKSNKFVGNKLTKLIDCGIINTNKLNIEEYK